MVSNLAERFGQKVITTDEVIEAPVKWCTVSLSEMVSRGKRLDATVFDVDGRQARKRISSCRYPSTTISGSTGLAAAYTCGRFKRIWVEKSEYPIFQPSTILDIKPIPDGYISRLTKTNIDSLRVKKGQILLTCSGTIGNVSLVSETLDNAIFSHDLLRITCKHEEDTGFLYAYLKTKTGSKILQTNSYGAVITHIEPEHLDRVPIPNPPSTIKRRIHDLVIESYKLRDESNILIDKATDLLIAELRLPPIHELQKKMLSDNSLLKAYSVKLSSLDNRIDASYHLPIANVIINHLQSYAEEVTTLGDKRISRDIILPGRFKRIYVEESHGRVFIGGKQLCELDPSNKKYLSLVHHGDRIAKQLELNENMILITCSGTIGKVALVPKHWENWTANQHIIRIVPVVKEVAGYLSVFLSSDYGYQLITRYTYGSVVDEIDDNHVRQIAFPLLKDKAVQKQINDLALEANAKRYEAYKLEQNALRIIDDEVIYAK